MGRRVKERPITNPAFTKYFTFPEYDSEEDMLKLEAWLYLIWGGEDPVEYLRKLQEA